MTQIKNKIGWAAIILLSLLPIVFWLITKPISTRFISPAVTLTSFGQIAGLVGMTMFAMVLILSGRFKFLEDYFGGLNKIYLAHHFFGGLAFILLLFHPLFIAGKHLLFSASNAISFLLPGTDWSINFGIFSLLFLIIFLSITFFLKLPYQKWKLTHKFLGLAFFLAGLHSFYIPSDISRSVPIRIYILSLAVIGLLVLAYRTILGFILIKKFTYIVAGIKNLGDKVMEIELSPKNKTLQFIAGQFAFISFQDKKISTEVHPFSLSSSPKDKNLKIAVKNLGDFTGRLANLKPGTIANIEGPFGRFYSQTPKDQIWIAGGIGITPFLSMARDLKRAEEAGTVYLFYCSPSAGEAVFIKEFSEIAAHRKNFKILSFCSDVQGFITAEYVKKMIGDLNNKEFFICGPPPMMKGLKSQFIKLGAPKADLHSEEFNF